jgi:outer membrane protein TolC
MLTYHKILITLFIASLSPGLYAEDLSLQQAVQQAWQFDPMLKAQAAELRAFEEETITSDAWPDPMLQLGVMSVPVDSFALDEEPMTQLLIGYEQMLPRGDSRAIAVRKKRAQTQQQQAAMELRRREIEQAAREAWLDVYWQEQTEKILHTSLQLARQQLDVSQSLYASGRNNQQDVLQADLEVSLVDDKLLQIESAKRETRARLAQLIGEAAANQPLADTVLLNEALENETTLRERLAKHPALRQQESAVMMRSQDVAMAQQGYKPQWGFEVSYGARDINDEMGEPMPDLLSVMLKFDMPIFTGGLQDRELGASRHMLEAERYQKQDVQLQLEAQLGQSLARWQQLSQRLQLYEQRVLNQAQLNARAALKGYQSGVVPFATLTQARNAELDTQMRLLDVQIEKAKVYAQLRFLAGDSETMDVRGGDK